MDEIGDDSWGEYPQIRARNSASFPAFEEAKKSLSGFPLGGGFGVIGLAGAGTEFHGEDGALVVGEAADAGGGECQEILHFAAGEGAAFGGGLDFDEIAGAGHDHVHVDFGAGVFFVGEVEEGAVVDEADADGGDGVDDGGFFENAGGDEAFEGEREGDESAGDAGGAGAAVGLDDVAVDEDGALADAFADRRLARRERPMRR